MPRFTAHWRVIRLPGNAVALAALLCGCAPGSLSWSGGTEPLRTALYLPSGSDTEERTTLMLSNGDFGCSIPDVDDVEALYRLQAAACREGAKHLVIVLRRRSDAPATGRYHGGADAEAAWWEGDGARLAAATWTSIDETTADADGLERTFEITDWAMRSDAMNGGFVEVDSDDDALGGRFHLPRVHASGRFRAALCPELESELFALLSAGPWAYCP